MTRLLVALVDLVDREPVAVGGLLQAVLTLAVAFGHVITLDQAAAIEAVVAAVLAFIIRGQVTPWTPPPDPPK